MTSLRNALLAVAVVLVAACSPGNPLKGDWMMGGNMLYAHFDDKTASGMLVAKAAMESGVSQGLELSTQPVAYSYQEEGETIKIAFEHKGRKFSTTVRKLGSDKLAFVVWGAQLVIEKMKS